jgi:hypothetical protein
MKLRAMLLIVALASGLAAFGFAIQNTGETGLIVHEWGTFTSIAGEDGMALDWRPLTATNDLPHFIHDLATAPNAAGFRHGCSKCDLTGKIRMETPVLYFYADRDTDVTVQVDFPKGTITEWYPNVRTVGSGIDWGRIAVLPGATANLPVETGPNRYYAARETDAALVRVCNTNGRQAEFEKFLFYRGVGGFEPPVSVKLDGNRLQFAGLGGIAQVVVFENHGGNVGFRVVAPDADTATIERPVLGDSLVALRAAMQQTLVSQGLYEKEAKAMLETWRDSWFEDGLRVFYILPRHKTDTVLPITISPQPTQLVRVLVGRIEVTTPEMVNAIRAELNQLEDASPAVRAAARTALRQSGRFAEPVLKRLLREDNDATHAHLVEEIWG